MILFVLRYHAPHAVLVDHLIRAVGDRQLAQGQLALGDERLGLEQQLIERLLRRRVGRVDLDE